MKKILGILLLAVLLVFSAGCITAEEDEVVGTWTGAYTENGLTGTYTLTLKADGTGISIDEYSNGHKYIFPVRWWTDGSGYYGIEEIKSVRLMEDGTLNDCEGCVYEKTEGGEGICGTWTEIPQDEDYYIFVFNEDGTGSEIQCIDGEVVNDYSILWREGDEDGIILFWYAYTYIVNEDGLLIDGGHLFKAAGEGEFVYQSGEYTDTFVFYEGEQCVRTITEGDEETNYYYSWVEDKEIGVQIVHGDLFGYRQISKTIYEGTLIYEGLCTYLLEEDGTLVCQDHGTVLTKTH